MSACETLSAPQARKLVLHSQQLPNLTRKGTALSATLSALEHLGYVQIDTISVIERAHHHTLWNRNPRYRNSHIDQLIADRTAFEYWSHAAAYLPMRDYRHSLPRKHAIKSGAQEHWYTPDPKLMRRVRDRIHAEGPLMAKDFEHTGARVGDWQGKPAKQALECLFMQGDLMISSRKNFHKVYELTERVLPESVDDSMPTEEEHARFLIRRYLEAHGLAQPHDFSYLRKGIKPIVLRVLEEMHREGELIPVQVGKDRLEYSALPASLDLLNKPLSRSKLKILSPFDNLVIQRKRMRDLFDFDYQIECYVPAAKRRHGYFVLPILWNGSLVARMDCKADRKARELQVLSIHHESARKKGDEFQTALDVALIAFVQFNGCETFRYP